MADKRFRLNRRGGAHVLKVLARPAVEEAKRRIEAAAGPDARSASYTTDRAAAAVSVPADQQARDGVLTRAAAAAGLEVRPK